MGGCCTSGEMICSGAPIALLAYAALEHGLDEDLAVALEQVLDLFFAGVGAQHLGGGEAYELQQLRAVQHACHLHRALLRLRFRMEANVEMSGFRTPFIVRAWG
jgi:hypothetical protein